MKIILSKSSYVATSFLHF